MCAGVLVVARVGQIIKQYQAVDSDNILIVICDLARHLQGLSLACADIVECLEPRREEAPHRIGVLGNHLFGRKDHVHREIFHTLAEAHDHLGVTALLRLQPASEIGRDAVDVPGFEQRKSRPARRRDELNSLRAPTFLAREFPGHPCGHGKGARHRDALALEIGR